MKKIFTFGFCAAFSAASLIGCSTATNTNTTTVGRTNANTATMNSSNTATVVPTNNMETSAMNSNSMSSTAMNSNSTTSTGAVPTDVNGFMTKAAEGGMAEIETSRLAVSKAQNAEVKQFAQQMIADHTRANNELKALAGKKNVTLPTDVDAMHKAMATKLSGLSGAEFEKEYMRGQVEDHERTVALFQAQANNGADAEAKALAAKTVPNLKMHLEMARKINDKLK